MANESAKRIAASNASILGFLRLGFLASNLLHLAYLFLWRHSITKSSIIAYATTEVIALFIWLQLFSAGSPRFEGGRIVRAGEDLSQAGATQYMLDIIYITFATHILTALVWRRFWWLYAVIPGYAVYKIVTLLVLPRLKAAQVGSSGGAQPALSKRQQKMQDRYGTQPGQRVKVVRR